MRSIAFLPLLLLACACQSEPSAPVVTRPSGPTHPDAVRSPDRTHVDGADFSLDLPGRWNDRRTESGHELRMGDREQIVISVLPPTVGLDSVRSAQRLAEAQQSGMAAVCKHVARASAPIVATTPLRAIRSHAVCEEPRVVATFAAVPLGSNIFSYVHYWYGAQSFSTELDRADDTILATLQLKAPVMACPSTVITDAIANGGTCLEAAVLGQALVEACWRELESRGWTRDDAVADAISRQTGKKLVCFQAGAQTGTKSVPSR